MIQRIQTLYLSLTAFLSLLLIRLAYLSFTDKTGSVLKVLFRGIVRSEAGQGEQLLGKAYPYSFLIVLIFLLSVISLSFYKNRKIQMSLVLSLIAIICILIAASLIYCRSIVTTYNASFVPGVALLIPVTCLIVSLLAYRGIRHDENLVRSYDRLR